mgnify:CR=1 FL=1
MKKSFTIVFGAGAFTAIFFSDADRVSLIPALIAGIACLVIYKLKHFL